MEVKFQNKSMKQILHDATLCVMGFINKSAFTWTCSCNTIQSNSSSTRVWVQRARGVKRSQCLSDGRNAPRVQTGSSSCVCRTESVKSSQTNTEALTLL